MLCYARVFISPTGWLHAYHVPADCLIIAAPGVRVYPFGAGRVRLLHGFLTVCPQAARTAHSVGAFFAAEPLPLDSAHELGAAILAAAGKLFFARDSAVLA